jgi:protein kinase C substrate 80K-H
MAVLEAVRGWEFLAGLPHIGVEEDAQAAEAGEVAKKEEEAVEEKKEDEEEDDEEWTAEDLSTGLDDLLNTDYVSLLLAHDDHVQTPPPSSRAYLPSHVALVELTNRCV